VIYLSSCLVTYFILLVS